MEKIVRHVENLLMQNDYVVIPELGGFVIHSQSAKITSNGIIPPLSVVGFNSRMNNNDGLLATEILRSENISYRQACNILQNEVLKIKNILFSGTNLQFGSLGFLSLNDEKQIVFTSSQQTESDILPVNFGLKTISIPKRIVKEEREITLTIPINNILKYASIILILLGTFIFSPKVGESKISEYAGIKNPLIILESGYNIPIENVVEEEIIIKPVDNKKEYHIIVSCLTDKKSAERYCNYLQARHYDNARVLSSIKTNRIALESFANRDAAISYLNNLRKSHKEFEDAWLHYQIIEKE